MAEHPESTDTMLGEGPLSRTQQKQTNEVQGVEFNNLAQEEKQPTSAGS